MSIQTWINYDGESFVSCSALAQGEYNGASYCEANIRALEDSEGSVTRYGYYPSRQLWLPDNEDNREMCIQLSENYHIVDEEMVSKVEMEWEQEAWDNYGWADMRRYLEGRLEIPQGYGQPKRKLGFPLLAEWLDNDCSNLVCDFYAKAMEKDNQYPTFESDGASLPLGWIAETFARLAIEYVIEHVKDYDDVTKDVTEVVNEYIDEGGSFTIKDMTFDMGSEADRKVCADWCQDNDCQWLADILCKEWSEVA